MAVNTRFSTGIHTLVLLAANPDVQHTSEEIARKLNTNPVVIRRVLSLLRQAGLVHSQKGPSGGSKLAKPGKAIKLGDVYRALEPVSIFNESGVSSEGAAKLNGTLTKIFHEAQGALEAELDTTSLNQLVKKSEKKKK
ncbi:Rrf2 family transcriptional regulator, group III [Acidisarcina polymorpha]|uniref:Rrf2 family transcriptional regulator, group III n=1 Tax=Acidisarcina polymorpha TaxID=2211140 RepID=A0A2Z5G688_9BACT|nr:Rrf2 family transcriptional regulator [Acidisarcina polymorpha]AXC14489.1 Rrf2 family transcriptional regulator, group III [Acidisarcina polymorpha]